MTGSALLLLALAATAGVADWIAVDRSEPAEGRRTRANQLVEYACKPLTLALLIGAALALDPMDPAARGWFVAALAASLAGDIFLMLPRDRFVPGLASFLLGHLAYVVGFLVVGVSPTAFGLGLVLVALAIAVVGIRVLQAVQSGEEPELTTPVLAYMVVISLMVACAVGTGEPLLIAGAVLFYASDSLIAWNRFVAPTPRGRLGIISTYHLAQAALVVGLV